MKDIKIGKNADKQLGVRIPQDIYDKCVTLSRKHDTSVQEIIRFILQEEINNYK